MAPPRRRRSAAEPSTAMSNWLSAQRVREAPVPSTGSAAMLSEGHDLMGEDTPAGQRLKLHTEFFEFVIAELDGVLERWEKRAGRPQ
jgi:hypothetical protein